jgi:hypothetical protein
VADEPNMQNKVVADLQPQSTADLSIKPTQPEIIEVVDDKIKMADIEAIFLALKNFKKPALVLDKVEPKADLQKPVAFEVKAVKPKLPAMKKVEIIDEIKSIQVAAKVEKNVQIQPLETLEIDEIQPEPSFLTLIARQPKSAPQPILKPAPRQNPNFLTFIPRQQQILNSLNNNANRMPDVGKLVVNAQQGNPLAQYHLSNLYSLGELVAKDDHKAFLLMQQSANKNLAQSQSALAVMYIQGAGVVPDYQQAYYWANKAANQDNLKAKKILLYLIQKSM